MSMRRAAAGLSAFLLVALTACGGSDPSEGPEPRPGERAIADARELGRFAMDRGRYEDAARMFADGLKDARARDDLAAIAELGYARALATLRAGDAAAAAEQAARLRRELVRREAEVPPSLDLVLGEAHYRLDAPEASERAARRALAGSEDPVLSGRARFLMGMIGADRGDLDALTQARAALDDARAPALVADRAVLTGRLALGQGRPEAALDSFRTAAERRRSLGDDMGMARALAFAGEAAQAAGRTAEAGDLYYRAGRTALLRKRPGHAEVWLDQAVSAAVSAGEGALAEDARDWLAKAEAEYKGGE
jgi:tetratricopeptide (TPR) repeat protein